MAKLLLLIENGKFWRGLGGRVGGMSEKIGNFAEMKNE
jgi:hypothetical protein